MQKFYKHILDKVTTIPTGAVINFVVLTRFCVIRFFIPIHQSYLFIFWSFSNQICKMKKQ